MKIVREAIRPTGATVSVPYAGEILTFDVQGANSETFELELNTLEETMTLRSHQMHSSASTESIELYLGDAGVSLLKRMLFAIVKAQGSAT